MPAVREAVVDGLFYPAVPAALRAQVVDYLAGVGAADDIGRTPKLLIAPHASYEYSDAVAAHVYALLGRRREPIVRRVVLLGPAHRVALGGLVLDVAPTPPATLTRARAIALGNGLHHVYTGNVHDVEGGTTFCPACHDALVRRDWYAVLSCRIETCGDARGTCPHCGTPIAGRFGAFTGGFGRRRIPVRMAVPTERRHAQQNHP